MQGHACHICGEIEPPKSADHQPAAAFDSNDLERCSLPLCSGHNQAQSRAVNKALQILRNHGIYNPDLPGAWEDAHGIGKVVMGLS
jgi:hypothetical protein